MTEAAVTKATGRGWRDWIDLIDESGGGGRSHKDIAAWLVSEHGLGGWWAQMVTVGYERATGRRVLGQTAAAGFQVGVRRTVAAPPEAVWSALAEPDGKALWLGDPGAILEAGAPYRTANGIAGEIRVVKPPQRVRLTRGGDGEPRSVVEIALAPAAGGRTALTIRHEKLAGEAERDALRRHWQEVAAAFGRRFQGGDGQE